MASGPSSATPSTRAPVPSCAAWNAFSIGFWASHGTQSTVHNWTSDHCPPPT